MKINKYAVLYTALATTIMLTGCTGGTKSNSPTIQPSQTVSPATNTPQPTISPAETPIPTDSPNPTNTPAPKSPTFTKPASSKQTTTKTTKTKTIQVKNSVAIESVTSSAARNSYATLTAKVAPNAKASIIVHYKTGAATAKGLQTKTADAKGNISWTWKVGNNISIGTWPITVSSGGVSAKTEFKVIK